MLSGYSMVSLTVRRGGGMCCQVIYGKSNCEKRRRGVLSAYSMVSLTVRRVGGVCCQVIVW